MDGTFLRSVPSGLPHPTLNEVFLYSISHLNGEQWRKVRFRDEIGIRVLDTKLPVRHPTKQTRLRRLLFM